jgi:hypothetical protein
MNEPEFANVAVDVNLLHPEVMAMSALGAQKSVCFRHKSGMIDWHGEFDVAWMPRTCKRAQIACCTAIDEIWLAKLGHRVWAYRETYGVSPHAPKAVSYSPPGTGCSSLSNVVEHCIRLTDNALISSAE